jgi:hypothetical protein
MPQPNNFEVGDGLNTAGYRFLRGTRGLDNLWGVGEATGDRKQINVKIDHNFTSQHKGNVNVSYERVDSDDVVAGWPGTFSNLNYRRPLVITSNFTSTLSASLVNEARFGVRRTGTNVVAPWDRPEYQDELNAFFPADVKGFRVIPNITQNGICHPHSGSRPPGTCAGGALTATAIDLTPVYTYADTLSWTMGKHAFKFGGEVRVSSSTSKVSSRAGFFSNNRIFAQPVSGNTALAPIATTGPNAIANTNPQMPGLGGTDAGRARHGTC